MLFDTSRAGSIRDSWGTLSRSNNEFINAYQNPEIASAGGKTLFSVSRDLAPRDTIGKDYAFKCGEENTFTWVSGQNSGQWTMKVNDDCSIY